MTFSWQTRVLLAAASGAALALAFPNYNLPLLAWVAPAMLILASYRAPLARSPLYGFIHGIIFYSMSVPWIDTVMLQYGGIDPWSAAGILAILALAGGILMSVFSWGIALASRKGKILACSLAPFLWVTLEFARAHLPIFGFPWDLTGYAASGNLALVQLVTLTGIYGLSFVVVAYTSLLAFAILAGSQRAWKTLLVATAVLIFIAIGGKYFVPSATPRFVAHLVQTNFPQSEEYPGNWLAIHAPEMDELESISVDAALRQPGIIVWPEVPAPFTLWEPAFRDRAVRIAKNSKNNFLVGVVDWKKDFSNKWGATNSAVLLDPSGQRTFTYDKIHLVPFGEYVPLRRWLTFAGKLTADIGDFTPGTTYTVGSLASDPSGDQKFSVFICYEAVFPGEIRRFARDGAELLINISNDGWFGRSGAPAQHLMMARIRAVENRRWLLRDTNNGFTVSVDPYGRIVARLAPDIRGQLDAPYDFRTGLTPYVRFGDWFAWLCLLASLGLLGAVFAPTKNGKRKMEKGRWKMNKKNPR
ncbi:MAG: apolipoprotein N-acyltransferase [Candidatus Acidiferrales bacterium]